MIRVTNLTKFFGAQMLLDDVTFQIHPGEKIGLVGRNGHGKTTLLRLLAGEVHPDEGEIDIPKTHRIGTLDQHLEFEEKTVLAAAAAGLRDAARDEKWRAEKLLSGLGFTESDFERPLAEFSGGFQMRVALVRLLLSEPDLLLLDEPTNYLDITSLRWLEKFLRSWPHEFVLITHDRSFLDAVCTHAIAIHRAGIKKIHGTTTNLFKQIALEEEVHERTRKNQEKKTAKTEKFIREFRSGARSAGLVQSRLKMLEKQSQLLKLAPIPQIRFEFQSIKFEADLMLRSRSTGFGYDENILFDGLDLELSPGDRVGIIGANGRGKSTLLRLLQGKIAPRSGTIKAHHSLQLGFFAQGHESPLDATRSVVEELHVSAPKLPEQAMFNLAGSLMFSGDAMHKKIEILSGGERARVALGKLMLQPHHALLLDEPTNHLDLESVDALIDALDQFDGAIAFVSHNELMLQKLATKLVVFDHENATVFNGGYDQFLKEKGWEIEVDQRTASGKKMPGDAARLRDAQKKLQKILRPLQRKIENCELNVIDFEHQQKLNREQISTAQSRGAILKIDDLTIAGQKIQEKIEKEFEKMLDLEQQIQSAQNDALK